ncbi:COG4223 family protein [Microvirga puerhi]|uniref:Inner membrane protein n=1 Tax=Microvirga puerhi TaxID=2876078 RepID=A0ABS7VKY8_9HYPH|nr:hypothetical protein [Microvirga puerhi]MBZ6075735.1 hypothetical protein [Microvirga puerhi]
MTDSFDPQAPKSSSRKNRREPATIDLEARVVDDGRRPDDTIADGETERLVSEAMAETEANVDSAIGTDSIAGALPPESETLSGSHGSTERSPPPQPVQPDRRASLGALLGAGLIGGIIGGGLVYGLGVWQKAPAPKDDPRVSQLEQRVVSLGQPANTQALENRLKTLEDARAALDRRLQAAEGTARQAEARAGEALSRPANTAPAPQDEAALKGLADRLAELEREVQAQAQATQQAGSSAQALQQSVQSLEGRVTDDSQRLAALAQHVGEGPDPATLAALRLSLTARLNEALRRGVPYADTLSALEKVTKDPGRLAPLAPFAQQGAPTAADLSRTFAPLRTTILRDDRAASGGSWSDRFWRMTEKVVTVRPVNDAAAAGVPGLVARIDNALARGDMAQAAGAWRSLPEPSRRLSEDWGHQVKARADAEAAAQAASDEALSALPTAQQ